jgi:membrane-associated PAP2 superfamily phosphatase
VDWSAVKPLQFWWRHVSIPLALLLLAFLAIEISGADVRIAEYAFFDAATHTWLGGDNEWTNEFIHTGGRWFVRAIVFAAFVLWLATFGGAPQALRRPSGYFVLACVLGVGLAGLLKVLTHVDCPWDLTLFGGRYPYVPLFVPLADASHVGACFPAAHAASGYVLGAGYFALRERSRRLALTALCAGAAIGIVFGVAQQARGAHFLSHDLCSAALTWFVAASLYVFAFRCRLWSPWQREPGLNTMTPSFVPVVDIEPQVAHPSSSVHSSRRRIDPRVGSVLPERAREQRD